MLCRSFRRFGRWQKTRQPHRQHLKGVLSGQAVRLRGPLWHHKGVISRAVCYSHRFCHVRLVKDWMERKFLWKEVSVSVTNCCQHYKRQTWWFKPVQLQRHWHEQQERHALLVPLQWTTWRVSSLLLYVTAPSSGHSPAYKPGIEDSGEWQSANCF